MTLEAISLVNFLERMLNSRWLVELAVPEFCESEFVKWVSRARTVLYVTLAYVRLQRLPHQSSCERILPTILLRSKAHARQRYMASLRNANVNVQLGQYCFYRHCFDVGMAYMLCNPDFMSSFEDNRMSLGSRSSLVENRVRTCCLAFSQLAYASRRILRVLKRFKGRDIFFFFMKAQPLVALISASGDLILSWHVYCVAFHLPTKQTQVALSDPRLQLPDTAILIPNLGSRSGLRDSWLMILCALRKLTCVHQ